MTLYEFNRLPYERQLAQVFDKGTFLARRWEEEDGVNLYHLEGMGRGYFVEVYYDPEANEVLRVRAFNSSAPLEDYAHYVQLPEG